MIARFVRWLELRWLFLRGIEVGDASGEWMESPPLRGDRVHPLYDGKAAAIGPAPPPGEGAQFLTTRRLGKPYRFLGGVTTQGAPLTSAVLVAVAGPPERPSYHVFFECDTERRLAVVLGWMRLEAQRWHIPPGVLPVAWIAEASMFYETAEDPRDCAGDPLVPPKTKAPTAAGRPGRPVNPPVIDRLRVVNELIEQGRLHVHQDCHKTREALEGARFQVRRPVANVHDALVEAAADGASEAVLLKMGEGSRRHRPRVVGPHPELLEALGLVLWWAEMGLAGERSVP